MNTQNKRLLHIALITAGILAVGGLLYILAVAGHPVPCLFHTITGLSCPGCGSTRAVLALLRLDIREAFCYNLLFPVTFFYLIFVYVRCAIVYWKTGRFSYRSPAPAMDFILLGVILAWWIVRNILHI